MREPKIGEYVLATKYDDGDPQDQWCVGFYAGKTEHDPPRHLAVDENGKQFRLNGFRRVRRITNYARVRFLLDHIEDISLCDHSVWWWFRAKMDF